MHVGHYISGTVHAGLLGWLLIGPVLTEPPDELLVTAVDIISPSEYAELIGEAEVLPAALPVPTPPRPTPPEVTDTALSDPAPPLAATPLEAEPLPDRPIARAEAPELVPDTQDPLPAVPEPDVPEPEVVTEVPDSLAPVPEIGAGTPEFSALSVPRAAPRVAPEATPAPVPDVAIAPVERAAPRPDATTEDPREEGPPSQLAEATTRITPEAQTNATGAVGRSLRPRARSAVQVARINPPVTRADTPDLPETPAGETDLEALASQILQDNDPADSALSAALFEALSDNAPAAPAGPPLSGSETAGLRQSIQACWNVDPGAASQVTVTIAFSMNDDGTVRESTVRLIAATDGDRSAVDKAFQTARRAVIRCSVELGGYDLPVDKYAHWKDMEVTFDPQQMALR